MPQVHDAFGATCGWIERVRIGEVVQRASKARRGSHATRPPEPHVRKPGSLQERPEFGRPVEPHVSGFEPAEEAVGDPRRRQVGARVTEHEPAVRTQDPNHLPHRGGRIRVVMERVRTQHRGELPVAEGQILGVRDLEPEVVEVAPQLIGSADHLRREIDPDDGRGSRGPGPRRGTRPAPDIEEPVLGAELQSLEGRALDRIPPPRRRASLVSGRSPIEPPPRGDLPITHLHDLPTIVEESSQSRPAFPGSRA